MLHLSRKKQYLTAVIILIAAGLFAYAAENNPPRVSLKVSGTCSYSASCDCNSGGDPENVHVILDDTEGKSGQATGWKQTSTSISGSLSPGKSVTVACTCSDDVYSVDDENSTSCPSQPLPPDTHLECRDNTCASVSGSGTNTGGCTAEGNRCGDASPSPTPPTYTYFACENRACKAFTSSLPTENRCGNDNDCRSGGQGPVDDGKREERGPEICGDGRVGAGEQCDLGGGNGACPSDCSSACTLNACGGSCELPQNPYFSVKSSDLQTYARRLENGTCYQITSPVNSACIFNRPGTIEQGGWRGRASDIKCDASDYENRRCYDVCNQDNSCPGCYVGGHTDFSETFCERKYSCAIDSGPYVVVDMKCNGSNGPCEVTPGGSATLSWAVTTGYGFSTTCSASGDWSGSKSVGGGSESTGSLNTIKTYSYILTCSNIGGSAQDTVNVIVAGSVPNNPSGVTVTEPNYCFSGPSATVNWTYSDPSGSPQTAYQIQIDNQGSFNSPEVDSGKVACGGCRSYFGGQGALQFNTTYKARVRVWNSYDVVSGWTESPSWKTPNHAYPNVNTPYQFTWSPTNPPIGEPVQFTDRTLFDPSSKNKSWSWTFVPAGGGSGSSTVQNPVYSFNSTGVYQVTESVRDDALPLGQYCTGPTQPVNVQKPIPVWKEVAPR